MALIGKFRSVARALSHSAGSGCYVVPYKMENSQLYLFCIIQ